jgi:ABC-type multidrug transport system fused ATPase/permease subunit
MYYSVYMTVRTANMCLIHTQVSLVELLSVLRHERMAMALATTGILGASISSMAIPGAVGIIIDALNNPSLPDASSVIMNESLRMLAIFSGGALATFVKVSQIQIIGQRVGRDLRKQLFASLISQVRTAFMNTMSWVCLGFSRT